MYKISASPAPGTNPITESMKDSCTIIHTKNESENPMAFRVAYSDRWSVTSV